MGERKGGRGLRVLDAPCATSYEVARAAVYSPSEFVFFQRFVRNIDVKSCFSVSLFSTLLCLQNRQDVCRRENFFAASGTVSTVRAPSDTAVRFRLDRSRIW